MTINSVLIRGDGVAARCCGHLLEQAGYRVLVERAPRRRGPSVMLSQPAQNLIRDIFQRDDLFAGLPRIRRRVVAWGSADAVELEHSAVVVSEESLLDRLGSVSGDGDAEWTICAARGASTVEHRFGSRVATVVSVEMKSLDACWIESVESGWLFLNSGSLIGVGAPVEELVEQSWLVKEQIAGYGSEIGQFPAAPRMVEPLGGERWIGCGSGAMGFDPICGDGTAHAVREAILASAVIRAADGREPWEELLSHYEARLTAGFERHLGECFKFYSSGGSGEWWKREAASCVEGMEWCRGRVGEFKFRLEGLELSRV